MNVDELIEQAKSEAAETEARERPVSLRESVYNHIRHIKQAGYTKKEARLCLRAMYYANNLGETFWPFVRYQLRKRWKYL